jgi:6-phosphogluconolactonase
MKRLALLALTASAALAAEIPFYIGTYTKPGGSQGIYHATLDPETGKISAPKLAAEAKNPSFLAAHPSGKYLYACNEGADGPSVSAFAIQSGGGLQPLNQQSAKGAGPCHVWVDAQGKNLLVANYGGGSIAAFPIQPDGALAPAASFVQHTGSSVNPQRQKEPHAHGIYLSADDRFAYVPDLGLDKVLIYRFAPATGTLTPNDPPAATVAPGSGPRHFALHPEGGWAAVINELLSTVTLFQRDAATGALREVQTLSTLPEGFTGKNSTAEIFFHPNGRFLYGSNRGHDSLAVFAFDAARGQLAPRGHTPLGGQTPRGFAIDPRGQWLVAGGQGSDDLFAFRIDPATGALTPAGPRVPVGAPVCILFPPQG